MNTLSLTIADEEVDLLADRALFWPRKKTLFLADLHFGKSNTFQRFGLPLIDNTQAELKRLDQLIQFSEARRVIFLGDLLHSSIGTTSTLTTSLADWLGKHSSVEFALVTGNHDRGVTSALKTSRIRIAEPSLDVGPFQCRHEPLNTLDRYELCGHLHPGYRLSGRGGGNLNCACFWIRPNQMVLPAFGAFTGTKAIKPEAVDQIVLVGDGHLKPLF